MTNYQIHLVDNKFNVYSGSGWILPNLHKAIASFNTKDEAIEFIKNRQNNQLNKKIAKYTNSQVIEDGFYQGFLIEHKNEIKNWMFVKSTNTLYFNIKK